jgi:hypothetical protein
MTNCRELAPREEDCARAKSALIEKANPAWVDLSKDWYDLEPADFKRAADRILS